MGDVSKGEDYTATTEDSVIYYRNLAGGGSICLARYGTEWRWKYRSGPNMLRSNRGTTKEWPHSEFSTIEEMAEELHRKIDYEDYVLNVLPTPRRREAIEATKAKA